MNRLSPQKQETAIHMLLEGCSIRSVERMTGIHRDTIMRLMVRAGHHCDELSRQHIRGFRPSVVEVDEAWSFVAKKDKRVTSADPETVGSQWIFIAMDRDSKLIPAFALGKRTTEVAHRLMRRLRKRITGRPKIVTDALEAYIAAVEFTFGADVDYTMMTKEFGNGTAWVKPYPVMGRMDRKDVSTSKIERQNLTLRNFVRRLNRKTLCFSKKLENLRAALSLHFCWYNFGRIHRTLSCTPAMEAGLAGSIWTVDRLLPNWN